jgi:hypothetical protein
MRNSRAGAKAQATRASSELAHPADRIHKRVIGRDRRMSRLREAKSIG